MGDFLDHDNMETYLEGCVYVYFQKHVAETAFRPAVCLENVDLGEYALEDALFTDPTSFLRIAPRSMAGEKTISLYDYGEKCPYIEFDATMYGGDPREIKIRGADTLRLKCSRNAVPDYAGCGRIEFDYVD